MRLRSNTGGGGGADALNLRFPVDLLHLFVLSCFAIAQPLPDLLAQYPTFFVAHRSGQEDILALAALLLVPLLVPVVVEVVGGRLRPRWCPFSRNP